MKFPVLWLSFVSGYSEGDMYLAWGLRSHSYITLHFCAKAVEEKKVLTVSSFLETHFKIEPNDNILRCFNLTETIFMYKKRMKNFAYKK